MNRLEPADRNRTAVRFGEKDMPLNRPSPLRQDVESVLASAKQLANWIAARQEGIEIKTSDSVRIPGVLLDLCLEHHVGIVHLASVQVNGSAFALLRVQFEALVRALWLQLCATQDEMRAFAENDKLPLKFGAMVDAIESHPSFEDKVLSSIQQHAWRAMNGYTHGGLHQIARRIKRGSIEPNYEPEEVIEVLKTSGIFALMALQQIGRIARHEALCSEVGALLNGTKCDLETGPSQHIG